MDELQADFWFDLAVRPPDAPRFEAKAVQAAFAASAVRRLGGGTFGETWLVERGGSSAAEKIIHRDDYPIARLKREVEGLVRCDSPHVVKLRGVSSVRIAGADRPVLSFEFIEGSDVVGQLLGGGWPTVADLRLFARGLARGVRAMHKAGVTHRDLKLENIALRAGSWAAPVVLDLGLARRVDESSLTTYPRLVGTLPYMAPEQVRGELARKGSDIWAVGVVLHLLVAREHPFFGGFAERLERQDALDRLIGGAKPLPEGTAEDIARLIQRCLSPQLYQRGSAQRLASDLGVVD